MRLSYDNFAADFCLCRPVSTSKNCHNLVSSGPSVNEPSTCTKMKAYTGKDLIYNRGGNSDVPLLIFLLGHG